MAFLLSKEELEELYVNQGLSTKQIGSMCGVNSGTVLYHLYKNGIPTRTVSEGKYKGAKTIAKNGYVLITPPGQKQQYEHRYVMEQHLGRKLKPTEHIHHIDRDRTNNDISNLQLFEDQVDHNGEHVTYTKQQMLDWVKDFYIENNRYPQYNEFTAFHYDTMRGRFGSAKDMKQACVDYVGAEWGPKGLPKKQPIAKEKIDYKKKVLELMYAYEKEHGRFPMTDDWSKLVGYDYSSARKRFGSADALWAAYEDYKKHF